MEPVLAWILAFMVSVAPPGRKTYYVEAQETREEAMARYESIAEDLVEVVYDPATTPLFRGSNGRSRTVSVMLAIMLYESGFGRNVDYGVGKYARGDRGNSWCMMQLNIGSGKTLRWNVKHDRRARYGDPPEEIFEGYTGEEMVKDRRKCFREGLKVLRLSFSSCRGMGLPLNQRLRVYGSGTCHGAQKGSALRMDTAIRWVRDSRDQRKLFIDEDISKLVVTKLDARRKAEEKAIAARKAKEATDQRQAEADKSESEKRQ
jgi:hypothetical protein